MPMTETPDIAATGWIDLPESMFNGDTDEHAADPDGNDGLLVPPTEPEATEIGEHIGRVWAWAYWGDSGADRVQWRHARCSLKTGR